MEELWKPIPGWPYEASTLGRIRRAEPGLSNRTYLGRVLRAKPGAKGYLAVRLYDFPRRRTFRVHTLVCLAFHGPRPTPKHGVAHWNGVRDDNRPDNLRWATQADNNADKPRHGVRSRHAGERHHSHKLTDADVIALRALGYMPMGTEMKSLKARFGTSDVAIRKAIQRETWRHLP